MVNGKPLVKSVQQEVLEFIGEDIIVGLNTSFDIRFLNAGFNVELENQYIDIL